jgi:uncharacterized membrane protein (DUF106 family)
LLHPLVTLLPLSVVLGAAMLWMFGRFSNQKALVETRRRLQAHLYEMRLFVDEPRLIWRAQAALLRDNARYLGLVLVPVAILAIVFVPVFLVLDCFYGQAPLELGTPAVVTVQLTGSIPRDSSVHLELPEGIVAETPPVRVVSADQISWRIRAIRAVSAQLHVTVGDETADKKIVSGSGSHYVSKRRGSSTLGWLLNPAERPLATNTIEWIEVNFPPAEIAGFGFRMHWTVWFLIISMAAAFLLRRRLGVTF